METHKEKIKITYMEEENQRVRGRNKSLYEPWKWGKSYRSYYHMSRENEVNHTEVIIISQDIKIYVNAYAWKEAKTMQKRFPLCENNRPTVVKTRFIKSGLT